MRVVIVGQGYVGLPIAMRAIEAGHTVVGYETERARVDLLNSGQSYVEDVSSVTVAAAVATNRYVATCQPEDCKAFEVALITVPTPLREGVPDLSSVRHAAAALAPHVEKGATVILESTTYPGTTNEVVRPILEAGSGLIAGQEFFLGYSPERIDPGNPTWGLRNTPKIVSGIDQDSLGAVQRFYDTIVDLTVPVSCTEVAELTKVLENTFRHVNIALVNELAMFAADLGIDVWEVIRGASTKPFGFMPFTPGPGVGGHCLPIDPSYLSWRVKQTLGHPFRFIELANDVNDHMPDYVVLRISAALNRRKRSLNGSRALVLGLAYKKNVGDGREAPGAIICDRLMRFGVEVRAVDPFLPEDQWPSGVIPAILSVQELQSADVVILVTDHDCFDWDLITSESAYIFDARNRLKPHENVEYL